MKSKKLFLGTLLFLSAATFAQSPQQRLEIKKSINVAELQRLETKFQLQFENNEQKVAAFLRNNPAVQRSETKNGSLYYIKSIDENGQPVYINTKSNIASGELIKANSLYNGGSIGANITGTGMVAGVWDGGQVRATHELLTGQATMQASQPLNTLAGNNHMTHVTGTMVGKNIGNTARGIAHTATARCYDWDNDEAEMLQFATDGFLISNHSYGMANDITQPQWTFGAYNTTAKDWDAMLKATPNYLPFVAGGNEQSANNSGKTGALQGYDVITGSSASKNVITVGAVNADRTMSAYSNFGPTDDGRIKPDICARGTGINSSISPTDTSYSGDGPSSSGTSYATPAAAAGAMLLQQYYFSLNSVYMTASMLKCLMLHAADDEGTAGPDMKFGWGIANIERAAQIIKDAKLTGKARMQTITTNPTNDATAQLTISNDGTPLTTPGLGTGEIKASMYWTDDEGVEQTIANGTDPIISRLVYNFDFMLERISPPLQVRPYKQFSMATLTATAALGNNWFENNVDNYRQTFIPAGSPARSSYALNIRKSATSPAVVRNISIIITGLSPKTTTWNGTTWSHGEPDANTGAIIAGPYALSVDLTAYSLEVTGTSIVNVVSGRDFNIVNEVTVASAASLTFENNANLLQTSATAVNTGNISSKRNTSIQRLAYTNWSSPVANQNALAFSPLTLPNRFYTYDESTNTFVTIASPNTTNLAPAVGYGIRAPNTFADQPAEATAFTGTFTGIPNNGSYSLAVTRGAAGYNLVGNPYPSTILASAFFAANTNVSALYFWDNANLQTAGTRYATINALTAIASAVSPSKTPSNFIGVGQGFFVQVSAAPSIAFNNGMRSSDNNPVFFRNATSDKSLFKLNLLDTNNTFNQIAIGYVNGATAGIDNQIDAVPFAPSATMVSSLINNLDYVIQGRALPFANSDVVPLGFKTGVAGNYSFATEAFEGVFANNQNIFLKDNLTGITHNIKQSPYQFTTNIGTFNNRFEIVYQSTLGIENPNFDANNVFVFVKNDNININSGTNNMKNVQVFDIRGRLVYDKKEVNATTFEIENLKVEQAILVVKITSQDGQIVTKKIIF